MAYIDVKRYFLQVQDQYLEMLSDTKELDEAAKAGQVSQENYEAAQALMLRLKENYERLCYIMFLFNQPARKKKKAKYNAQNSVTASALNNSSEEAILAENADVLKQFKELINKKEEN